MPALPRLAIVSGTPSCNLSSIAVAPTMCKPFSTSYATEVNFSSLFSMDVDASLNFESHSSASSSERTLTPRTSVRRPSDANSPKCACMLSKLSCLESSAPEPVSASSASSPIVSNALGCSSSSSNTSSNFSSTCAPSQTPSDSMDESAPLQSSMHTPPSSGGDLTRTDMRFRSESNLLIASMGQRSRRGEASSSAVFTSGPEYLDEAAPISGAVRAASDPAVIDPLFRPFATSSSSRSEGQEHDSWTPEEFLPVTWKPYSRLAAATSAPSSGLSAW
mmetsp:Transcript_49632/g.105470  ORF Transcript_49632/g.105470 Transcript_49632/m.105470 type:complete len:277 (-) Transcript_49632:61-891(-)